MAHRKRRNACFSVCAGLRGYPTYGQGAESRLQGNLVGRFSKKASICCEGEWLPIIFVGGREGVIQHPANSNRSVLTYRLDIPIGGLGLVSAVLQNLTCKLGFTNRLSRVHEATTPIESSSYHVLELEP